MSTVLTLFVAPAAAKTAQLNDIPTSLTTYEFLSFELFDTFKEYTITLGEGAGYALKPGETSSYSWGSSNGSPANMIGGNYNMLLDTIDKKATDESRNSFIKYNVNLGAGASLLYSYYGDDYTFALSDQSILIAPTIQSTGALAAQNGYSLADYGTKHALTGSSAGTGVHITGSQPSNASIAAGRTGQNYGTAESTVTTWITYDANFVRRSDMTMEAIIGGNQVIAPPSEGSTTAHFYGNTNIVVESTGSVNSVVGGNKLSDAAGTEYAYDADFVGSTHIKIEGHADKDSERQVGKIVGGNYLSDNETANLGWAQTEGAQLGVANADFQGDTNIVIGDSATKNDYAKFDDLITGGNYGNSTGSSFKGNSHIDINAVTKLHGLSGASVINAAADTSFTGNTYININEIVLASSPVSNMQGYRSATGIMGGFNFIDVEHAQDQDGVNHYLTGTVATLTGDTNIKVNLSGVTAESAEKMFDSVLIGGSRVGNGLQIKQIGTASINIENAEHVEFNNWLVGGNYVADVSGFYNPPPSRSTSGMSALGMDPYYPLENLAVGRVDNSKITISSGNFTQYAQNYGDKIPITTGNLVIAGSVSAGAGHAITGNARAEITGGHFDNLIGGNASVILYSRTDEGALQIRTESAGTTQIGHAAINISAGTGRQEISTQRIVGGSYIDHEVLSIIGTTGREGAAANEIMYVGSTQVNIEAGSHQTITAGSLIGKGIGYRSDYQVTQGDLSLSLQGGSVNSDYLGVAGIVWGAAPSGLTTEMLASIEDFAPLPTLSTDPTFINVSTDTVTLDVGREVSFGQAITVSGSYEIHTAVSPETPASQEDIDASKDIINEMLTNVANPELTEESLIENVGMTKAEFVEWAQAWLDLLDNPTTLGESKISSSNLKVLRNRQLNLKDGEYKNLAKVNFVEFDELNVGRGSQVDFQQSGQDLASLNGRNQLAADGIHVIEGDFSGENTLRKTGAGTLMLSAVNGQVNKATPEAESNLQLVVEAGTVVLAANSSATTQTDFKTLVIQSGARLDMSAGNNTVAGAAGINGHLNLEQDSRVIADASRYVAGTGTSMTDGSLTVNMDFILDLKNIESIHLGEATSVTLPGGSTASPDFALGAFEVVLFSGLTSVAGIDFVSATWGLDEVQIAFAADYISRLSNGLGEGDYFMGDDDGVWESDELYLVLRNGDLILTSGSEKLTIPEPSTATLSLLALAGLLARRRRG